MRKLKREDIFFVIFLASILMTRIFLFLYPIHSPILWDFHMHHYMYGIILVAIGLSARSTALYAIGAGLFADEALLLNGLTDKGFSGYFAPSAMVSVAATIVVVYFLRRYLVWPLHEKHRR